MKTVSTSYHGVSPTIMTATGDSLSGYDIELQLYREDELVQEHWYRFDAGPKRWDLQEIRRDLLQPQARAGCRMVIEPDRYREIELSVARDGASRRMQIDISEEGAISLRQEASVRIYQSDAAPILFDGPGPMFDWINAVLIIGIADGESIETPVYRIDPDDGALHARVYRFEREGSSIIVRKGFDPLGDSRLFLDEGSPLVTSSRSCGYRYEWRYANHDPSA